MRLEPFLVCITASGHYSDDDNEAIITAVRLLPAEMAASVIERVVCGNVATSPCGCGDLLHRAVKALPGVRFDRAARLLTGAVADLSDKPSFRHGQAPDADFVFDLMSALCAVDPDLSDRACALVLERSRLYGLDGVVVPACCRLAGTEATQSPAVQRLLAACREHLANRIAEQLEAPKDWKRSADLDCDCSDCAVLGRFLDDPDRESWTFRAAQDRRSHVEDTIRRARSDVDVATDKRGRPHSLVCTKNSKSHDDRMRQRKQDLENLSILQ